MPSRILRKKNKPISTEPQSELDSWLRELLSRVVEKERSITLDISEPVVGQLMWKVADVVVNDGFKREVTIWWVPSEDASPE
jgi:hypothetical protein